MKTIKLLALGFALLMQFTPAHAVNYNGYVQGESPVVGGWWQFYDGGGSSNGRAYFAPFGNIQPLNAANVVTPVTGMVGIETAMWSNALYCTDGLGNSYICGSEPPAACPQNTVQMSAVNYVRSDTKSLPTLRVTSTSNTTTAWVKSAGIVSGVTYYGICFRWGGNNYCTSASGRSDPSTALGLTSVIDEVGYKFSYPTNNMTLCVQTDTYQ